jgi:hypothetical protein
VELAVSGWHETPGASDMTDSTKRMREAGTIRVALEPLGAAAAATGVLGICFGSFWASRTLELFSSSAIGRALEILVPFLPILLVFLGAFLLVESRR